MCSVALGSTAWAATYYVSPSGNDSHSGGSPDAAWKTLQRVNLADFQPGDRLRFEGGKVFAGTLRFDAADRGAPESPITVGTYRLKQGGRAIIDAGDGRGIDVYNVSGLHLADLRIRGSGPLRNRASGIFICTSLAEGAEHIRVENIKVSGFGRHGISLGAWETTTGYHDVRISRTTSHDNRLSGINTWGPWGPGIYAHTDVSIDQCLAYDMKGGSGIVLSSVNGGIVERSVAHSNGEAVSGAVGIWAWDANNILFQYNESHNNRTIRTDGGGFDFDGGVTNSVMQYNYSHDNAAAGFLLAQYAGSPNAMRNIVIRYNISENDCRTRQYGAIHLWNNEESDRLSDVRIYNNTIYLSESPGVKPSAIAIVTPVHSVAIHNNLFFTSGGETLVSVVPNQTNLLFQNNAYWSDHRPFHVHWQGLSYHSLEEWLAAADDQERIDSQIVAIQVDPMLNAPGTGGTLALENPLTVLTGYKLQSGSPLVQRGINLADAFGIDVGSQGFFGAKLSDEGLPNIGAHLAPPLPEDALRVGEVN